MRHVPRQQFLQGLRGVDLATVTSPPLFLAPLSVLEAGTCWAENPSAFAAPALEASAEKRALLVLRWFLLSLKRQFYVGDIHGTGYVKKPLNAFLGEILVGTWHNDNHPSVLGQESRNGNKTKTQLLVEQVSHHPPTTALYVWDAENGISGQAFSRVKMVFNTGLGSHDVAGVGIDICQAGHGMLHIDRFDEDHLIPAPRARIKGLLSGSMFPELVGTSYMVSSAGFVSEIRFSPPETGRGVLGWLRSNEESRRNRFEAVVYRRDDADKTPLYKVSGQWSGVFTIADGRTGEVIETCDLTDLRRREGEMAAPEDMDPWESRRAWGAVTEPLSKGHLAEASREKTRLEKAQREMRVAERHAGKTWEPLFFEVEKGRSDTFDRLAAAVPWPTENKADVMWKVKEETVRAHKRPFRQGLTPFG